MTPKVNQNTYYLFESREDWNILQKYMAEFLLKIKIYFIKI